jgi:hypothetical protein
MLQAWQFFYKIPVDDLAERNASATGQRVGVQRSQLRFDRLAYVSLRLVDCCVEGLNLEFALPIGVRIIVAELPRKSVGAGYLTHTTGLIPLAMDSHHTFTFGGADESIIASMVLYGVVRTSRLA